MDLEILSHAASFALGLGPTAMLVIREKAKRQSAEATALSGAVAMAKEAMSKASIAEESVKKCEASRGEERDNHAAERRGDMAKHAECERRTNAVYAEMMRLRVDLENSGTLTKSEPEHATPSVVVEAWNERFAEAHPGKEAIVQVGDYDEPEDMD